ncbi:MAG: heavy metal translocating P-type ATPase, partial [Pseudomonadota bacterium]
AQVNLATSKLTLDLEGPLQPVLATMEEAGYPAKDRSLSLPLDGASCASCVARIEARAQDVPGVLSAQMALATDTLHLRVSQSFDETALHSAFEQTKFELGQSNGAPVADQDPLRTLQRNAALAAALTLPVVVLEMGGHLSPGFRSFLISLFTQTGLWTLQAVLTTLVLAGPGRDLFVAGFRSLRHRAPDMNALVTLGAGAAFLYSLVALLAPGLLPDGSVHVYFEAAAVITTLILVGRWLEGRARNQAKGAIGALLALQPPLAEVIEGEQTETRPVAELSLGTLVRLHPGAVVPVDGQVVAGRSEVDEALVTGEPVPVPKAPGDRVIGGSLNGTGSLDVRVTALAGDSVLAKIAAQVEAAQAGKLPVQHMVDRITAWFVPAVLALAAVTCLAWLVFGPGLSQAMVAAISVLIIACPCAMGLAVPVSILVGTG